MMSVHDYCGTKNNVATPPDGPSETYMMYVWTLTTSNCDRALQNDIVVYEFTHRSLTASPAVGPVDAYKQ